MRRNCPGFSLIELLVAISLLGILFGLGVAQYNQFNRRQILSQATEGLKNTLSLARNKALSGEKNCEGVLDGYEVTFTAGEYNFRSKCSPGPNYGTAQTFSFPSPVVVTSFPTQPILFKVLGQGTNITGSVEIKLAFSATGDERTVTVTSTGEIK